MFSASNLFRVPDHVSDSVRAVCRRIAPRSEPSVVACEQRSICQQGMCFENVARLVADEGGEIVYGWLIWEWPKTVVEAEHHAVWRAGGRLVDVTPQWFQNPHHVFLSDPACAFDFEGRRRRDNWRFPLRSDPAVREYMALAARRIALEEEHSTGRDVCLTPAAASEMVALNHQLLRVLGRLAEWSRCNTGRNEACWCGSRVKHKACHGRERANGGRGLADRELLPSTILAHALTH